MVIPNEEVQKQVTERERCRTDLQYLSEQMGDDFVPEVHQELFECFFKLDPSKPWAQQSESTKSMILWPRGHFKTRAIVVFIVQIILNFPDIRILIMQGSTQVTQTLLTIIKAHFSGENNKSRIPQLFPDFCSELGMRNPNHFTVPARRNNGLAQATVTVASPRSIKTGQHYDIGFFDDLVNDQNYNTKKKLNKIHDDFYMCLPLIDPPHYSFVSGTRYAFGDLYEEIARHNKGEWRISLKTCWTDPGGHTVRFPQSPTKDGRYVGFTRDGLVALRNADPQMFASQYLNQPRTSGTQAFTPALLGSTLVDPEKVPALSEAVLFIDLASTDARYSDDCVIVAGKHDANMVQYVVDCRGDRWLPPKFAEQCIEMAVLHRPVRMLFEKTPPCTYFVEYLRLVASRSGLELPIDFIKVDAQDDAKNMRIGALAGLMKSGILKIFAGIPRWARMVEQFTKWAPGGKAEGHDDYPDTVALMARHFGGEAIMRPRQVVPRNIIGIMEQQANQNAITFKVEDPEDGVDGFLAF